MNDLVQDELKDVLGRWHRGEGVSSIVLGHSVRRNSEGAEEPHVFRQKKVHAFVFALLEICVQDAPLVDFAPFDAVAREKAHEFELSAEEQAAGTSLAWVALRRGWARALSNFPDGHKITVKAEAQA